jgi:hypothetical protein
MDSGRKGPPLGSTDPNNQKPEQLELEAAEPGEWTSAAGGAFLARVAGAFPGAHEVSDWAPRPGSELELTPEQCADSAERVRLWQGHGVRWVKHPPPDPPTNADQRDFDLEAWLAEHPEIEDQLRCQGTTANGERCTHQRRPGSRFCGVHTA